MRVLFGLGLLASGLAGWFALWLVALDAPVFFHLVYGDGPDPDRPGHLKTAVVSPLDFYGKIVLTIAMFYAAWWCSRHLEKKKAVVTQ